MRAIAMDEDETLKPEERRALIEIALEVERRETRGRMEKFDRFIAEPT